MSKIQISLAHSVPVGLPFKQGEKVVGYVESVDTSYLPGYFFVTVELTEPLVRNADGGATISCKEKTT